MDLLSQDGVKPVYGDHYLATKRTGSKRLTRTFLEAPKLTLCGIGLLGSAVKFTNRYTCS